MITLDVLLSSCPLFDRIIQKKSSNKVILNF